MSKQANPAVIGGFVLGALLLFVGALIVFGSGALLRERIGLVTFFPGSVQGLNVGAQVQFQGVPIGQVTSINLDYKPDARIFRIPVRYDIWPRNVELLGGIGQVNPRDVVRKLVEEKGLRARLESVSIVTGQYVVALSLNPHLQAETKVADDRGAIQIPAIEATRDRIEDLLATLPLNELVEQATGTLEGIHHLFASGKVEQALTNLDLTLAQSHQLLRRLNADLPALVEQINRLLTDSSDLAAAAHARIDAIAPAIARAAANTADLTAELQREWPALTDAAKAALEQTSNTLATLNALMASDSPTRYQLDTMLRESTEAARSLRALTDYLERHPEALLSGKSAGGQR
jgi:paraquat-inducible protein B